MGARALDDARKQLEERLRAAAKAVEAFAASTAGEVAAGAACAAVLSAATELDPHLAALIGLTDGTTTVEALDKALAALAAEVTRAATVVAAVDCAADVPAEGRAACDAAKTSLDAQARLVTNDLATHRAAVANLSSTYRPQVAKHAETRKLVAAVLADPEAFVEGLVISAPPDPTGYTLVIRRTERAAPHAAKEVTVGEILVGTPRFSISGGLGVSVVESREFGRQSGPGEGDTVVPVFAVTEESDERLAAVLQLNGCFARCVATSGRLAWSLGMGVGAGEEASDVSLYTGPAFGFIDGKWWMTLAYHQREVEELSGFAVGDPIPDGVQDPLPTRQRKAGGLLLTVTYKIR
jgi:hypothetical protein